jgi:hypothetical protein
VYVVQDGVAKIRPLTLDRVLDGVAVITSGLQAGEMVLAAIPNKLRDGSAVRVATKPATAPAAVDGSAP